MTFFDIRIPRLKMTVVLAGRAIVVLSICFSLENSAFAMMDDDSLLTNVMFELEYLPSDGEDVKVYELDAWLGRDGDKIWVKSSGELSRSNGNGFDLEGAMTELDYGRAAYTVWDQ